MEGYIGEIRLFVGGTEPSNWARCEGQVLRIADYVALYSVVGTRFGGDGKLNFALPDLRGRTAVHRDPTRGDYALGHSGGARHVTLDVRALPEHHHEVTANELAVAAAPPNGNVWSRGPALYRNTTQPDQKLHEHAISEAGEGKPHENMQAYQVLTYLICLNGMYPQK